MSAVKTKIDNETLFISGDLNNHSVVELWNQHKKWNSTIKYVDISDVSRIDSAGLSLLIFWKTHFGTKICHISEQMNLLLKVYNLKDVINHD